MSARSEPFVNNYIYHVFTRTIDGRKIFVQDKYPKLFMDILRYYRSLRAKISYSKLKKLRGDIVKPVLQEVSFRKYFRIDILAYCLMPTHFHLLLRQRTDRGIPRFISDTLNSFTRYFNIKNDRKGPLFLPRFKAVLIRRDAQLFHATRYIHLNPYKDRLVKTMDEMEKYPWSSYHVYVNDGERDDLVDDRDILKLMELDKKSYRQFVTSRADYQRTLEAMKYVEKW